MSLWVVRAGRHGEREQEAIENNFVVVGWNELPDLSKIETRVELSNLVKQKYPDISDARAANWLGQLWRFLKEMKIGDLVVLPLKSQSTIAVGEIESNYQFKKLDGQGNHIRAVKWIKTVPRSAFDQDLLYSFGALQTVCQVQRNDAENRLKKLLKREAHVKEQNVVLELAGEEIPDVEELARDQIMKYVGINFKGHELARLVEAILQAQGYVTEKSPPGPDGGVDILAASGTLGFDRPKICVQVKSTSAPVDVKVLRELQGVMSKVRAEQGLLVSWGGFNGGCLKEARDAFFSIRLWDQGNLIENLFKLYERFDDELKAELPLKRVWTLVTEEKE